MLCDRCLTKSVDRRFKQALLKHNLISPGEFVVLALSGGKDSVTCLHLLTKYRKRLNFELGAVTVDEGIKGYREESLAVAKRNTEELGVPHHVVSFKSVFGATLDQIVELASERRTRINPCTYCGVLRRSLLNQAARELGADKLVTAHNLDDEVQAIMMNYLRGNFSRLHRLGPIYSPRPGFVPRVKPMREIPEKEIAVYALLNRIEVHLGQCPHLSGIHLEVREFLNKLEANHPTTKFIILRMFDRLKPLFERAAASFEPKGCELCGEPTSAKVCKGCELLGQLGLERRRKTLF